MPIPDYQDSMLPLLEAVADGTDYHLRAVTERVAGWLKANSKVGVHGLPCRPLPHLSLPGRPLRVRRVGCKA